MGAGTGGGEIGYCWGFRRGKVGTTVTTHRPTSSSLDPACFGTNVPRVPSICGIWALILRHTGECEKGPTSRLLFKSVVMELSDHFHPFAARGKVEARRCWMGAAWRGVL
eukprot:5552219-Prorocentrum_lima.AAC.1